MEVEVRQAWTKHGALNLPFEQAFQDKSRIATGTTALAAFATGATASLPLPIRYWQNQILDKQGSSHVRVD